MASSLSQNATFLEEIIAAFVLEPELLASVVEQSARKETYER